jgi:hypothetical protein
VLEEVLLGSFAVLVELDFAVWTVEVQEGVEFVVAEFGHDVLLACG